jgi:hypothetical protein
MSVANEKLVPGLGLVVNGATGETFATLSRASAVTAAPHSQHFSAPECSRAWQAWQCITFGRAPAGM